MCTWRVTGSKHVHDVLLEKKTNLPNSLQNTKSYKTLMNIFHFPWNPLLYEVQYYHCHITESLSY